MRGRRARLQICYSRDLTDPAEAHEPIGEVVIEVWTDDLRVADSDIYTGKILERLADMIAYQVEEQHGDPRSTLMILRAPDVQNRDNG